MFNEIGKKIKNLAAVIAWLGIIASAIIGLVTMEASPLAGILTGVLGALGAWIGSFLLYGFGELVDQTWIIAQKLSLGRTEPGYKADAYSNHLDKLLQNGVITEEEYEKALRK